jgi:hypothetical protein
VLPKIHRMWRTEDEEARLPLAEAGYIQAMCQERPRRPTQAGPSEEIIVGA